MTSVERGLIAQALLPYIVAWTHDQSMNGELDEVLTLNQLADLLARKACEALSKPDSKPSSRQPE